MKKIFIKIILILPGILLCQPFQNNFTHFTMKDGLPSNQTNPIIQDHLGYIWIGSNNGVSRYDGYEFLNFSVVKDDSNFLQLPITSALYEDSNGDIWIGSIGGISKYDREKESFKLYSLSEIEISEDRTFVVTSISETEKGDILFSVFDMFWRVVKNGLYTITDSTSSIEIFNPIEEITNNIFEIIKYKDDEYLICGYNGFAKLNIKDTKIEWADLGYSVGVSSILQVDDACWLGVYNKGLYLYDLTTSEIKKKIEIPEKIGSNGDNGFFIFDIISAGNNDLYFTTNKGLGHLDIESGNYDFANYDVSNPSAMHSNSLNSILKDRSGSIWITTNDAGISKYNTVQNIFRSFTNIPNDPSTIGPSWVSIIFENDQNELWFKTEGSGISVFNRRTNQFKNQQIDIGVSLMYRDRADQIWIASDGLYKLDQKNWETTNVNIPISMEANSINVLYDDSKNNFWIGTYTGLFRYDRKENQTAKIDLENLGLGTQHSNEVFQILEDDKQKIWIGTNNGLFNYSYSNQQYSRLGFSSDSAKSLNSQDINSLYIDEDGIIWVGTWLGGLNRLDPLTGEVKSYTTREGFNSHSVQGILGDEENGALWLSSFDGISRFDIEKEEFQEFGIDDGIQGNQFAQGSALKTKDGLFLFGGQNGVTMFRPQDINRELISPELIITDFKLFNESVKPGEKSPIKKPIYEIDKLELDHNENDISFEYLAIHYADPVRNKYAYRLLNYQNEWRYVGNQRNAVYPNLPPGDYVFQVKAANNNSVWNEDGKSIQITIASPPWSTWWAYSSYLVIFFGLLYSIRKIELTRQKKNAEIKESTLRAEAAELQARAIQAENDRKTKELEEARSLQLSMLPKELPQLPNLDIAVYMKTATEVGGDYYDFHIGMDGTLTAVLGDATGHGMKAGTMVTSTKSLFNVLAPNPDIKATFHEMTRCFKLMKLEKLSMCMTMLKISGNKLQMSAAGMPPVYIYRNDKNSVEEHVFKGMPLGTMENFPYVIESYQLNKGDTILMMSDGFPELMNDEKEMYGFRRTRNLFEDIAEQEPEEIIKELKETGSEWINGNDPDDDVTFVVIKVK